MKTNSPIDLELKKNIQRIIHICDLLKSETIVLESEYSIQNSHSEMLELIIELLESSIS